FIAPELYQKDQIGRAADWWALGVTTYKMMVGTIPFRSKRDPTKGLKSRLHAMLNAEVTFPTNVVFSEAFKSFVLQLLQKDPNLRLGSRSYDDIKNHAFLRDVFETDLLSAQQIFSSEGLDL